MNTVTPARTADPFRLALFWLGIQAVWGAILGISLQARTIELATGNPVIAYGRLAAVGATMAAITQIIVGVWSDVRRRGGSRRVEFYVAGAAGGAVALWFFYRAGSFPALVISYAALQITLNLAIGPYQAIIPDFVERTRQGAASSWMAALQSAGNAVGALTASFVAKGEAIAAGLGALLVGSCVVTSAQARGLELRDSEQRVGLRVTRPFIDLFVSRALVYVGFYTLLGYLLFYVQAVLGTTVLSQARLRTGILIVAFTLVGVLGAAFAARPSDRLDKRVVATIGGAAFMLALGLFIASREFTGAVVATLIAGIGWGIFLVADWAIACRVLPQGAMAAAMGVWNLAVLLAQVAAPALTTAVLERWSLSGGTSPRIAFGLAFGETLVGIAWLWRISREAIAPDT